MHLILCHYSIQVILELLYWTHCIIWYEQLYFVLEYDMSIMVDLCAHPTCNNHASKYTFPVCYEHLGSPYAITRAASATRVVQLPHAGQISISEIISLKLLIIKRPSEEGSCNESSIFSWIIFRLHKIFAFTWHNTVDQWKLLEIN